MPRLALQVSGAGIILWNDFWKATSRIITGSSLQSIMSGDDDAMQVDSNSNDGPPLLLTQSGEDSKPPAAATAAQSDEELARKLAEEWGSPNPEHAGQNSAKSDEDLARELQAQWNAGSGTSGGMDVVDLRSVSSRPPTPVPTDADLAAKMSAEATAAGSQPQSNRQQLDFEKHGDSFPLYHYNVSDFEALPLQTSLFSCALNPFVSIIEGTLRRNPDAISTDAAQPRRGSWCQHCFVKGWIGPRRWRRRSGGRGEDQMAFEYDQLAEKAGSIDRLDILNQH